MQGCHYRKVPTALCYRPIPSSLELDSNPSFFDFLGQHLIRPSTQLVWIMTLHHRKLCYLLIVLF